LGLAVRQDRGDRFLDHAGRRSGAKLVSRGPEAPPRLRFVEYGAKRCLSGQEGGYYKGAWWRSLYMVMVHALLGRDIGDRWACYLRNAEDAEYVFSDVAFTNLDKTPTSVDKMVDKIPIRGRPP
jgi:hypothetical protein